MSGHSFYGLIDRIPPLTSTRLPISSSDRELAEVWPQVAGHNDDVIPPMRFSLVMIPRICYRDTVATPRYDILAPLESTAGSWDEDYAAESDDAGDRKDGEGEDRKDSPKVPKGRKMSLHQDIKAFIEVVRTKVAENKEIKEALDRVMAHTLGRCGDKKQKNDDGEATDAESDLRARISAMMLADDKPNGSDGLTGGIVGALLTPALLRPPPPPGHPSPPSGHPHGCKPSPPNREHAPHHRAPPGGHDHPYPGPPAPPFHCCGPLHSPFGPPPMHGPFHHGPPPPPFSHGPHSSFHRYIHHRGSGRHFQGPAHRHMPLDERRPGHPHFPQYPYPHGRGRRRGGKSGRPVHGCGEQDDPMMHFEGLDDIQSSEESATTDSETDLEDFDDPVHQRDSRRDVPGPQEPFAHPDFPFCHKDGRGGPPTRPPGPPHRRPPMPHGSHPMLPLPPHCPAHGSRYRHHKPGRKHQRTGR